MDSGSSGIRVVESPPGGQPIPVARETVAAFIGPAPRGPADIPVAVRSVDEFLARFGAAGHRSRLELLLRHYFDNGGAVAIVVRVVRSARRNRIVLPGPAGALVLEALNPGPLEHLRASVDYEGIAPESVDRFNLVIHRCASTATPLVEEQESYHDVSILPGQADSLSDALAGSQLVRLAEPAPAERPTRTLGADGGQSIDWIASDADWQDAEAPGDYDLIGSPEEGTGLFALDQVPAVDLLYLLPGLHGASVGPVALFAAERYARARHALLVLDPPARWATFDDVIQSQRQRSFASPDALTYFPALEYATEVGTAVRISAAGAVMGLLAGGDAVTGPWRATTPGLPVATGPARPVVALEEWEVGPLNRRGVNALVRRGPGRTEFCGDATLARFGGLAGSWNELRRRRTALFIVGSIARYTRWAACCPADAEVWRELRDQVAAFLAGLHERGALAGATTAQAFYVKCDSDTNRAEPAPMSAPCFVVGLALRRAGEFLAFEFRHQPDACEVSEISWQPGLALAG